MAERRQNPREKDIPFQFALPDGAVIDTTALDASAISAAFPRSLRVLFKEDMDHISGRMERNGKTYEIDKLKVSGEVRDDKAFLLDYHIGDSLPGVRLFRDFSLLERSLEENNTMLPRPIPEIPSGTSTLWAMLRSQLPEAVIGALVSMVALIFVSVILTQVFKGVPSTYLTMLVTLFALVDVYIVWRVLRSREREKREVRIQNLEEVERELFDSFEEVIQQ